MKKSKKKKHGHKKTKEVSRRRYKVVKQVLMIIRNTAGKVLLGLRKNGDFAGYWMPPGGHIDRNEKPDIAACRETWEEVSLVVAETRPIGRVTVIIENTHTRKVITVFEALNWSRRTRPIPDGKEFSELKFCGPNFEAERALLPGDESWLPDALRGKCWFEASIGCGASRFDLMSVGVTVSHVPLERQSSKPKARR